MDFRNMPKGKSSLLAGVAAGIANYQGINPIIVRGLFVFLTVVTGGIGILVYTVLAFLMPPAR